MFFVAEIQRQIVLKFQIFQMNSFEDIIVGSWSSLTENTQVTGSFHYSCQTRFFLHMVHLMFFVADIQRQIVLKFQNFQMNSFEDIIVGSCRGSALPPSPNVLPQSPNALPQSINVQPSTPHETS